MLNFHVVTLFPELISTYCSVSMVHRGIQAGAITVKTYNPRDFCTDKYRKVDDTPYGGGAGMVLKPEPFFAAVESIERKPDSPVILMTPQGRPFKQTFADQLATECDITIICGHYEGFDERIRLLCTDEFSIGDFVLTGGELPALSIIDSVARLVPGVIGKLISVANESFVNGLLEAPQYTKPAIFRDLEVPEVLRSGNHREVEKWRRRQALQRTWQRRPDLLQDVMLNEEDRRFIEALEKEHNTRSSDQSKR